MIAKLLSLRRQIVGIDAYAVPTDEARREAKKIATDRESSTASRCSSTRERRVTRPARHFEARDPARGERAPPPWRLANVPC